MQKNPFCKGNLYIKVDIDFPADGALPPDALAILQNVLPQGNTPMIPGADDMILIYDVICDADDVTYDVICDADDVTYDI